MEVRALAGQARGKESCEAVKKRGNTGGGKRINIDKEERRKDENKQRSEE